MASVAQKYRALVELAPDPIFLAEMESGTILETNRRAAEKLGYDRADLEAMDVADLHPPDRADAYRGLFRRTVEQGTLRAEELPDGEPIHLVAADGDRVPVELHARTIELDSADWILTIARDVTDRRERERELRRRNEELDRFASVVSHDLRNPLNVAQARIELARGGSDGAHLERAAAALERMESLIEDTLALAAQGQTITETEPVRLVELLDECWRTVGTVEAELEIDLPEGTTVRADPERLRRGFENLFRNAVEHADGPSTVRVGTTDSGLFVADDGSGIPPEERGKVFEPGYTTAEDGTGFGLAIVAAIVEAHGWEIGVTESAAGGARFEITGVERIDSSVEGTD